MAEILVVLMGTLCFFMGCAIVLMGVRNKQLRVELAEERRKFIYDFEVHEAVDEARGKVRQ